MESNCKGNVKERMLQWGGNLLFSLLIFVIMFDPTNKILHLKDVFFILLVGYNLIFFKPDFRFVPHIMVVASVILTAYIFAEMQQNNIDYEVLFSAFKSVSPLFMLLWVYRYDVIKLSLIPAFLVSLLVTVLYVLVSLNPVIEGAVWRLSIHYDDVIMMSRRQILGIPIFAMYYKSLVCFIFAYSLYFYLWLNGKKKRHKLLLIPLLVTLFAFLASGSRTTMLLPFFIAGVVAFQRIRNTRYAKYFVYPVLGLFFVAFLCFVLILAMETSESSNEVKYAHLVSYTKLFEEHPVYLLLGQGPGTSFYSAGFGEYTALTEWSYLEVLRNYGVFGLGILAVFAAPLVPFFRHRDEERTFVMLFSYVAYLLIAGTNPLLLSSTGMLMVLSAYSYDRKFLNPKLERNQS